MMEFKSSCSYNLNMILILEGNLEISTQAHASFMYEVPQLRDSTQQIPVLIYCILYAT